MTNTKQIWERDPGYSYEETTRRGDFAAVIVPPEYLDGTCWGYQIFDEADEAALDNGDWFTASHGLTDREAARRVAEVILEELAAARA